MPHWHRAKRAKAAAASAASAAPAANRAAASPAFTVLDIKEPDPSEKASGKSFWARSAARLVKLFCPAGELPAIVLAPLKRKRVACVEQVISGRCPGDALTS